MLHCSYFSTHEKESKPNLEVNSGFFVLGLNSGSQSLVGFLQLCSGFQLTQDFGFREPKFLELGNPDSLQWRYILMNFFNTLADDHGGAESQLWGGGGLHGARDIPSSCIMRKMLLFVTYSAGIYLHTFSHKKKKAQTFLGISLCSKTGFLENRGDRQEPG